MDVEHAFIKRTHFDPQIEKVMRATGVDLRYHSHTLNDVVWSTAVQHGAGAGIIITAMRSVTIPHAETKTYDSELISAIYAERGRTSEDGSLYYFRRNSRTVQEGVARRFVSEKRVAIERLNDEQDY
ncbi:hypothetical protein L3D22_10990 [Lysobacter soli]|nr:hypothetical protein [Lysobacter soli]UTA52913.1 hypothetical protein L3D22_10990 [Lysobacter soli]